MTMPFFKLCLHVLPEISPLHRVLVPLAALFACSLNWPLCAQSVTFSDSFESPKGWVLFEEIVGDNPCYAKGVGSLSLSPDRAYSGRQSLRLWSNAKGSAKSNHVIAVNRLGNSGRKGKWTYGAHVFVEPGSSPYQSGPEISIQNTRSMPDGAFRTFTAAVQYQLGDDPARAGSWAVWREKSPGKAGWEHFLDQRLSPGKWYRISVEVDYDTNRYGWFTLEGDDLSRSVDISATVIAAESRHSEEAFAITLEGENLWNNCGKAGVFGQRFYYDDVSLKPSPEPAAVDVHPSSGIELRQRFRFHFRTGAEDRPLSVVNALFNRSLDAVSACHVAYSISSGLIHLMNERGDSSLQTMRVNGPNSLQGPLCDIHSASAQIAGPELFLDLDIAFHPATFAGEHTIFLAARDTHGGNSGWIPAGAWRVGTKTTPHKF